MAVPSVKEYWIGRMDRKGACVLYRFALMYSYLDFGLARAGLSRLRGVGF
jgi:hypothetical protein